MSYQYPLTTNFPDQAYLLDLLNHEEARFKRTHQALDQLITYSGAELNWVADFITDPSVKWTKEIVKVNDLYLTGTSTAWNKIVIDGCQRSPQKLRQFFQSDPNAKVLFKQAKWHDHPILIQNHDHKLKVFDGMHRTIAAIRDGKETIEAYVGKIPDILQTVCEPHVVYDLLKPYLRKQTTDKEGLLTALKYLRKCYRNVDDLLISRFNLTGIPAPEVQALIKEALTD